MKDSKDHMPAVIIWGKIWCCILCPITNKYGWTEFEFWQ